MGKITNHILGYLRTQTTMTVATHTVSSSFSVNDIIQL